MTEKVNPSPNRPADAFTTAGAIAYGGGSRDGYIVPSSQPTELSKQDSDITESNFNNFAQSSSSSSLTVSIDAGEAFIFGSWVVTDNSPSTNITLQAGSNNQTVYIGWNKDAANDVIIGLYSSFDTTASNSDQKIPLYSFDTDSNGVINVVDERQIGKSQDITSISAEEELVTPVYQDSTNAPEKEGNISFFDGSGSKSSGLYLYDGSSYTRVANSDEKIEDIVSSLVTSDNNLSWSYNDTNDTLTVSLSNSISVGTLKATNELGNPTYSTLSDVPTNLPEGTQVYVKDENSIYVEDGT
jgi:3D (Asp-Asp-Asp) domain-containing protein